jgi:hypothetical protein
MEEFAKLYWIIETQGRPFDYMAKPDWNEIEVELERYLQVVDQSQGRTLWRPGVFPRFAELLRLDEWSFLIGLRGSRANAIHTWAEFAETIRSHAFCSEKFFLFIQEKAEILIVQIVCGVWEVYPSRAALLEALSAKYARKSAGRIVDSEKWQHRER